MNTNMIILEKNYTPFICLPGFQCLFDDIKFVLKAYSPKQIFGSWHNPNVVIQDGKILVTDGHRIHLIDYEKNEKFQIEPQFNGQYTVKTNSAKMVILKRIEKQEKNYPDFFSKMKNLSISSGESFEILFDSTSMKDISSEYAKIIRKLPSYLFLNFKFIADLGGQNQEYTVEIKKDFLTYFQCMHRYVAIMPTHIEGNLEQHGQMSIN